MPTAIERWKERAYQLKTEVYALYLAYKNPRTPWYAKVFTAVVVGYAFSPIDLIPDPIPVLGYLDDLVLIPLGAYLVVKMIPTQVMEESRVKAKEVMAQGIPVNTLAAGVIVLIWIGVAVGVGWVGYRLIRR
ncbi:MAG TPA: YkvA family protein [Anaerolineales bacterium]|nr:YkvA family protein [Anaerolineales bacterium]